MQTKSTSCGKKLLALMLSLLMLVSVLPVSAWAVTNAAPEKITLVGSSDALEYEFVDYLSYMWEDLPHYKVYVPTGTKTVQLYGTVHVDSSSGSGYGSEDGLTTFPVVMDYWTADQVGSSSPYTIETRTSGYEKNLSLVKTQAYGTTNTAYVLEFVEKDDSPAAPAPVLTADLSTAAVTYTCGDKADALAVQATGSGTLSYQWQVSTTSAADGFEDITDATQSSYTPSTEAPGSFWYRVVVTNTVAGNKPTSITSAVTPVTVNVPEGMRQVKITTSKGRGTGLTLTLKDAAGQPVAITADTSGSYAVYEFLTAPGTYTYEARDTVRGGDYQIGTGTLTVTEGSGEQTFELYLTYVYASNSSSWTADDFTTEVKAADGTVMTPGEPHQFASYVGYPYLMAPGTYTWSVQPSEARAAEGYQASQPTSQKLTGSATWSVTLPQIVSTDFVVPKGGRVVMRSIPSTTYGQGTLIPGSADLTGDDSDVYTFQLVAGSSYIYQATGDGLVTATGMFKSTGATSRYDLTQTMTGDPKAILWDGQSGAADIRLNGVDYTGSIPLSVGGMKKLHPLRMFQISNNSAAGSRGSTLEPVFHYTALDVEGTNVVSVDEDGRITANSAGTAIVLVTYDAMHVTDCGWDINKNKTFSAIWPENTGVVVVEVGENAANGPAANMTINDGDRKVSGDKLDAEADVLYYTGDDGCRYTFQPAAGSTVTLLRPTLTETAMTYTGGFGTDGVTVEGNSVTLTLTEGKNIVKISKDGADTYQVITVKKAGVVITNKTDPTRDILPGDTVTVQLTGVYHPANSMANLYNLYAYVSYTDPGSDDTVTGYKNLSQRHYFDRADGNSCRTVEVKIPADWDADEPYVLTDGVLNFHGNGKDIGSHRNSLPDLSTSVPYIGSYSSFELGALPDITIPVTKPNTADVTFSVKDDAGAAIDSCTIRLTNSTNDTITINATAAAATRTLASGEWSYVVTKEGYLPAKGTLTVVGGEDQTVNVELPLVTAIQVKTLPKKTVYTEGDTLNAAGLVVQAVTKSGTSPLTADQYTLSPTLLDTVGQQTITVAFGQLTTTFEVTVREDIVTLETTLEDGITQRNSRLTFDVFAKDGDGNKLPASEVTVLLNGQPVGYNWNDDVKTSYTLHFTQEGENTIVVKAHKASLTYTVTYVKAEPGEVIGKAVFTVEALSLGGGYIIEPCYVDIVEGENAAQALARLLEEKGFTYSNTGSLESGFYLSHLQGDALADIDPTGDSIPQALREKLEENGFEIRTRSNETSLGEFDYTQGSGWMYCLKNVFPNVGFADSYLSEGDVVRVQFTLAYGSDIGGGYAMGTGGVSYYEIANKDALTRRVAAINAEIEADPYYLEKNCLTKAYDAAMDVLTTLYVSQADVDAALADLPDPPVGHQLTAVAEVPATCTETGVKAHWKCEVCGKLFSDAEGTAEVALRDLTIPATGHDTELVGAKDATCTEDGYTGDEVCKVCKAIVKQGETIPATGHDTELVGAKDATCTEDGYTGDEVCKVCQTVVKQGEVIPATGHDTELVGAKDATCTEDGYTGDEVCKVCKTVVKQGEVIPATGHDTELVGAKDATCTEDGYTGDEVCKVCKAVVKQGEVIPATGHDTELVGAKDATCTEDGYTGDEVCKVCQTVVKKGEVIPATGHDYKDGKCSRCGAEEPTTPVEPGKPEQPEKPTQPDTPATGDSSTLVLWLALLVISGMAVAVIPSRKKRSR